MKWNQPALHAILRVNPTPSVVPQAWKIRNGQSGCLRGLIMFLLFCAASQRSLSNGICDICGFKWYDLKSYINGLGRRPGCKVFSPNPSPDRCPAQDFVCEEESLAFHLTKKMVPLEGHGICVWLAPCAMRIEFEWWNPCDVLLLSKLICLLVRLFRVL